MSTLPPELIEAESLVNGNCDGIWNPTQGGWMGKLPTKAMRDLCWLTRTLLTAETSEVGRLKAERDRVLAAFSGRYVSTEIGVIAEHAAKELQRLIEDVCRIRGECNADENLKRFVDYIDHALDISPGEVSRIIDFAQGQMKRAESAEAAAGAMRGALAEIASHDLIGLTGAGLIVSEAMRAAAVSALQPPEDANGR